MNLNKDQKKILDIWIDTSLRCMREKFRTCATCWVHGEFDLMIENAKDLKKELNSFIDYLERKRKFE